MEDLHKHSGTTWASPGSLRKSGDKLKVWRYPCGCVPTGSGTAKDPVRIEFCKVHGNSHALLNAANNLVNSAPNIPHLSTYQKAVKALRNIHGRLTSSL